MRSVEKAVVKVWRMRGWRGCEGWEFLDGWLGEVGWEGGGGLEEDEGVLVLTLGFEGLGMYLFGFLGW